MWLTALALAEAAYDANARLDIFEPFLGHCYVAQVGPETVDRHCFSALYGGAHVRDEHVVTRAGKPVYSGATIFSVEGSTITFTYFNSLGGVGRGTAEPADREVRFRMSMRATPTAPAKAIAAVWRITPLGYEVINGTRVQRFTMDD